MHLLYNELVTDAMNAREIDFAHLAPKVVTLFIQRMTDAVAEWLQHRLLLRQELKIMLFRPNIRTSMKLSLVSAES